MRHRFAPIAILAGLVAAVPSTAASQADTWTIPADAEHLTSPAPAGAEVLKQGQKLFGANCEKCHGPQGAGNGPYADPKHPPADLSDPTVGAEPEGVLFYKIWNGKKPMPAFKSRLTQ